MSNQPIIDFARLNPIDIVRAHECVAEHPDGTPDTGDDITDSGFLLITKELHEMPKVLAITDTPEVPADLEIEPTYIQLIEGMWTPTHIQLGVADYNGRYAVFIIGHLLVVPKEGSNEELMSKYFPHLTICTPDGENGDTYVIPELFQPEYDYNIDKALDHYTRTVVTVTS